MLYPVDSRLDIDLAFFEVSEDRPSRASPTFAYTGPVHNNVYPRDDDDERPILPKREVRHPEIRQPYPETDQQEKQSDGDFV